ncbi:hypothetical protein G6F66_008159 [Rhizopus arrhizus]|nr:hypothetical protein G6F66_008159 [Rhizopus arrhizus]
MKMPCGYTKNPDTDSLALYALRPGDEFFMFLGCAAAIACDSPIELYKPLLRAIWSSPLISRFAFLRPQQPNFTSLPISSLPLKALAYADDALVFLTRHTELQTLLYLVSLYGKASNTRLNRGKNLAVSLSGEDCHDWRQTLFANGITQWHDKRASSATTYLGYPLTGSAQQLTSYLDSLIVAA